MSVPAQPPGYHTVTPYLMIRGASEAIAFYKEAFGAVEVVRIPGPGGRIGHAEIKLGDSIVMLADEHQGTVHSGPQTLGGTSVSMLLYDPDVDARFAHAVSSGATVLRPVLDQFYGDRTGTLRDPFGHEWTIATHQKDVSHEEMRRIVRELAGKPAEA